MPILRGNGTQILATSIVLPGATGGPLYLTKSGAGAPPYSFAGDTNSGLDSSAADTLDFVIGGGSALVLSAAVLRLGLAASATPAAQTLTLGENSRSGTDTDVGGSNGTVRSGLGTGTGTASSLIFQTPTTTGAGTGAQSYATRLTVATASVTSTVQIIGPDGSSGAPTYAFASKSNAGMYYPGGDSVRISTQGFDRINISTTTIDLYLPLKMGGRYIEGDEQTAPSAPGSNSYRIFAQDNGAGKTQLMVIFASGAAQQIAIQP